MGDQKKEEMQKGKAIGAKKEALSYAGGAGGTSVLQRAKSCTVHEDFYIGPRDSKAVTGFKTLVLRSQILGMIK